MSLSTKPNAEHSRADNSSRLVTAGILVAACLTGSAIAETDCKTTPALETKLGAHPTADAYTELGTWFGEQHQFDCANRAFHSALKLDPKSAKLNYFLGLSLSSSGQLESALEPLQRSVEIDAKALQPRLLLANVLRQLGRKSDAEAEWRAALQIAPDSSAALDGLSTSLIAGADYSAAIELLRNAKLDEDTALDLVSAYGLSGMLDEAAATAQAALVANPSSLRLTNALATAYVHQHRYQDAATLLQKCLEQHPGDVEAQILYLRVVVLNNDSTAAQPLATKLLAAAPHDFDVLYLNGILEREAGEYAAARDHLQEAVKLQPEDYSARYNLGTALAHLNDDAGAKLNLEKAVALDPTKAEAHFQLAAVLRKLGENQAAQDQLKLYQQLSRASTARSESDTKAELALQKLAAGDAKQAASLYREAVEATPDNALLQYRYATALDQAGDTAGERAALEQAVKIDPTFALAQNQLGYLISRAGETAAAEEHFRQAVKAAPAFIDAWINLAATLGAESHFVEAQQAVATALQLDPSNAPARELSQQLDKAAHQ